MEELERLMLTYFGAGWRNMSMEEMSKDIRMIEAAGLNVPDAIKNYVKENKNA